MNRIVRLKSALVDSLSAVCTMSGRDAHFGTHIVRDFASDSPRAIVRDLSRYARSRRFSVRENAVKITEPSVEGFMLLLERYSKMLHALSDSWRLIADGTEEDREGHPAEIWIRDSRYARQLADEMDESVERLRKVWKNTPDDMREIVEIKIKKVKEIDGTN
tara:strand:- start:2592 stop:3077 length:486 start_codon:yes stop_codon:yes gene_type:complete